MPSKGADFRLASLEGRHIAVLWNWPHGASDFEAYLIQQSVQEVFTVLKGLGAVPRTVRVDLDPRDWIPKLCARRTDAVINLAEGFRELSTGEIWVASVLELLGIPYTGSRPMTMALALDKVAAKGLFMARGISTPQFCVYEGAGFPDMDFPFPAIVKFARQDGSLFLEAANLAATPEEARAKAHELWEELREPVLIERFIDGREFAVSFLLDDPLEVGEIVFDVEPRILTYAAKWVAESPEYLGTRSQVPANLKRKERLSVIRTAEQAASAIQLRHYSRVDLRMTPDGALYVLEVNPNPDLGAGDGYRKALDVRGISFPEFWQVLLADLGL